MRYSSEYEVLEEELGRAQSIHGGTQPDWRKVLEISEGFLRQQSKDLRVAVWLCWALHQRESFSGLLAGLGLLCHLCEHHWPAIYPVKVRTRGAAFSWLALRLQSLFAQALPLEGQRPLLESLLERLLRLDELCTRLLGQDAPLLQPIHRQLAQQLERAAQKPAPVVEDSSVVSQVSQEAVPLKKTETLVASEEDAQQLLSTLRVQSRPLCNWWLSQNATDLRALRLNRTLAWLTLANYPDAGGERITALHGPEPGNLKRHQERFAQGHYADLIHELEACLASTVFWFDGLHMLWQCLEALQADRAMTELEVTFALLLLRLPDLPEFRFHDGSAFANTTTRDWIAAQVHRHLQVPEAPPAVIDVNAAPWEAALLDAAPTLRNNGLKAAVHQLKQGMQAARDDRARFHWQLAQARLCMQAGKHELAHIQLEHLDTQLHRMGLERWEPELTLHVTQLLHRCCDLLPQSSTVRERKEETHRRLCLFDLETVLE